MSRARLPLFALALSGLPFAALAQDASGAGALTGERILACEADRAGAGCATLLTKLFVCDRAEAMTGCADLLAMREAALNDTQPTAVENEGIVPEPGEAAEDIEVEVRAEGELTDEIDEGGQTEEAQNGNNDATNAAADVCPVIASDGWAAFVNAMPGTGTPQLIVTGTVTLPTPVWSVALELGNSDRSERLVQEINLTATPPSMIVAQVLSDYELRLEAPSLELIDANTAPYGAIRVVCAGQEIAFIEPVEVAQ